MMGIEIPA